MLNTTNGGDAGAGAVSGEEFAHQQQQQLVMGEILDYKDGSLANGDGATTDNHHNYATANAVEGGDHYQQQQQHLYQQRIPGGEYQQPSIKNEAL